MRDYLKENDLRVKVVRPIKTGEIRLVGFDLSVTLEEVAASIARAGGGCSVESVRVGIDPHNSGGLLCLLGTVPDSGGEESWPRQKGTSGRIVLGISRGHTSLPIPLLPMPLHRTCAEVLQQHEGPQRTSFPLR